MKRSLRLAALLPLALLPACSTAGQQTEAPICTSSPLCKNLALVKPSRKADKIGDATAQTIADNNIAIEQACEPNGAR